MWRVHRWLFQVSGGRIGSTMNGFPILLLTTRGRRSGEPRRVALQYLEHGEALAVAGSYAGEDRDPAWWLNLMDAPEAEVMIGGQAFGVRAREAIGAERAALYDRFIAVDSAYAEYAKRTTRTIPVVILERR
jgi:deazaflavin-dependent oxidoreductase (nitroreductase family)